jgi:uncharacterized protein (TIGR03435 family)
MAEDKYDLVAKVPPGATRDDLKLMLQDLLMDRFKLSLHRVRKDFPVYELTIAKGGSKLKENTDPNLTACRPGECGDPLNVPLDKNGFPQLPPGKSGSIGKATNGIVRMTVRGLPLSSLLFRVRTQLGTITGPNSFAPGRIVDKTGLTGKYDFNLEYAGEPGRIGSALSLPTSPDGAEPGGGLPLIDAIEKQLGLKLTKTTAPYEVLVIDHAERIPAEN